MTRTDKENWTGEGMFDGIQPYITDRLWEVRTGLIPSDAQPCTYGKVLVLSDFDHETNLEWWNDHVEEMNLESLKVKLIQEYTSISTFEINRGVVFVVENEKTRDRDKNDLLGSEVIIDGINYIVKGVESYAMSTIPAGAAIGLLVSEA